jgi:hypothetical protein
MVKTTFREVGTGTGIIKSVYKKDRMLSDFEPEPGCCRCNDKLETKNASNAKQYRINVQDPDPKNSAWIRFGCPGSGSALAIRIRI